MPDAAVRALAKLVGKVGALDTMEADGLTETEIDTVLEFYGEAVPAEPCRCAVCLAHEGEDDGGSNLPACVRYFKP